MQTLTVQTIEHKADSYRDATVTYPVPGALSNRVFLNRGILPERGVSVCVCHLRANAPARIWACGQGDVDIYIYDRYGVLVRYDNRDSHIATVGLAPLSAGEYVIKVVNNEYREVKYRLDVVQAEV